MKQISHNTIRADVEKKDQKSKDNKALIEAKRQEAEKQADPTLTAEIIQSDPKTLKMKWVNSDTLNEKIGI